MTREEIERLAELLRSGSWRNFEALSAADALISLLADRDRLETAHAQMQRSLDEVYAERDRMKAELARCLSERDEYARLERERADRLERERDDADNAIARISQSLGGPDEWADQHSMIADAERRVASTIVRVAELEAMLHKTVNIAEETPCYYNPVTGDPEDDHQIGRYCAKTEIAAAILKLIQDERIAKLDDAKNALARVAELEAALGKLIKASSRLAIAAQTTGGVAGRDEGLCLEIDRLAQPLGEARAALAPKES